MRGKKWSPITDLPSDLRTYQSDELQSLSKVWQEQRLRLEKMGIVERFLEKLRRHVAVEAGVIERLYTLDRGVTFALIEQGLDESLIAHGTADRPAQEIMALIRDQKSAIDQVFNFVGSQRDLSTSFIKQLHQLLTRHQDTTQALDQFGNLGEVELIKGDWKRLPNNPRRTDGSVHEYCPPEQVESQMIQMLEWHLDHLKSAISPEVEAAWLHHRFTQIHPFQDGNGRVARLLATLVLLKAGWFPLVLLDENMDMHGRTTYIEALEKADDGNLNPLIALVVRVQKRAFVQALSLSQEALSSHQSIEALISSGVERVKQAGLIPLSERRKRGAALADQLVAVVCQRFEQIAQQIRLQFQQAGYDETLRVSAECGPMGSANAGYYRKQIIDVAKRLSYYANLSGYKAWAKLNIRVKGITTVLIVSFHELGTLSSDVLVVSAFAFRRSVNDESGESEWGDLEVLSDSTLTFTFQDSVDKLKPRVATWIDEIIRIGLIYWQKGLDGG